MSTLRQTQGGLRRAQSSREQSRTTGLLDPKNIVNHPRILRGMVDLQNRELLTGIRRAKGR